MAGVEFAEMRIAKVVGVRADDEHVEFHVVLEEIAGDGLLPILIGAPEAMTLSAGLGKVDLGRPQTPMLAAALVRALRGQVQEVRIDRVEGGIYFATVEVAGPAGTEQVDARPSDALNLAVLFSCPVRTARLVLAEAVSRRAGDGQEAERLRLALEVAPMRPEKRDTSAL